MFEIKRNFENNPRIYFLYKKNYELFVQLLKEQNIPYIEKTIPDVIGYGIMWDKEHNEKVEKIKLDFFSKVL